MLGHQDPVRARQLDEPRVGNPLDEIAGVIHRHEPVSAPVQDERRALDERQHVSDVGREQIAGLGRRLTRSRGGPQVPRIALPEAFVPAPARCGDRDECFRAPQLRDHPEKLLAHLGSEAVGVVVAPHVPCRGLREHERRGPLGIGGGEQHGHRPAVEPRHDGRVLRADGVQDDPHVVGPLFPRGQMVGRHRVRDAGPAPIEEDDPGERAEPFQEVAVSGPPLVLLEVREVARGQQEIDGTVADDLVGDVEITASRVPGLGFHRRSLPLRLASVRLFRQDVKVEALKRAPLFESLSRKELAALARVTETRRCAARAPCCAARGSSAESFS